MIKVSDTYNKWKKDYDDKTNKILDLLINDLISILEEKHDDYEFCINSKRTEISHRNSVMVYIETRLGKCVILYSGSNLFNKERPVSMTLNLKHGGSISQDLSFELDSSNKDIEHLIELLENYWNNIKNILYMRNQKELYRNMNLLLDEINKENENE